MNSKSSVTCIIRVNAYDVISRAVEEGVTYGLNRAYKHTDSPTRDDMELEVAQAVTNELCEVLMFDHGDENA